MRLGSAPAGLRICVCQPYDLVSGGKVLVHCQTVALEYVTGGETSFWPSDFAQMYLVIFVSSPNEYRLERCLPFSLASLTKPAFSAVHIGGVFWMT